MFVKLLLYYCTGKMSKNYVQLCYDCGRLGYFSCKTINLNKCCFCMTVDIYVSIGS